MLARRALLLLIFAALIGLPWPLLQLELWRQGNQQQRFMATQAVAFDRQLEQLAFIPRLLATDPRIVDALPAPTRIETDRANQVLAQVQRDSGVAFAYLMDTQGKTIAASNHRDGDSFVGENYGFRPYFRGAMQGGEARFFGVGATTGRPGYFISLPISVDNDIKGVVVVKLSLQALVDSWREQPYESVVVDELGVVILSTRQRWLYAGTRSLDNAERSLIAADRRYTTHDTNQIYRFSAGHWRIGRGGDRQGFLAVTMPLESERWTLKLLLPRSQLWWQVCWYMAALLSATTIIALVYYNNRQNRILAEVEQRHAQNLEGQVEQRTAQLKSAQQALVAHANFAMLGRMSAAINHEINQPLASLRLNMASLRQLIGRPQAALDEIAQIVVDSDRTTSRIGRVVATLRSVSRNHSTTFQPVELGRLIDDVVAAVQRERPHSSTRLHVSANLTDSWVAGNEVLLQQALLNLLYNAFDAVLDRPDSWVCLASSSSAHDISILVQDNGPGVPPSVETDLFQPFVTDPARGGGLGLGLTLAQQIAGDHQGQLHYRSGNNGGSEFILVLPRTDAPRSTGEDRQPYE